MPLFVEAAGLHAIFEDRDAMAMQRQSVGGRKACRAGTDDSNRLTGGCGRRVELPVLLDGDVSGIALQAADLDGAFFRVLRTQASSQSCSVGQTRAHMPPRIFWSKIVLAEPSGLPVWICG